MDIQDIIRNEYLEHFFCDNIEDSFCDVQEFSDTSVERTENFVTVRTVYDQKKYILEYKLSRFTGSSPFYLHLSNISRC